LTTIPRDKPVEGVTTLLCTVVTQHCVNAAFHDRVSPYIGAASRLLEACIAGCVAVRFVNGRGFCASLTADVLRVAMLAALGAVDRSLCSSISISPNPRIKS
jgi:hypothetical protein